MFVFPKRTEYRVCNKIFYYNMLRTFIYINNSAKLIFIHIAKSKRILFLGYLQFIQKPRSFPENTEKGCRRTFRLAHIIDMISY